MTRNLASNTLKSLSSSVRSRYAPREVRTAVVVRQGRWGFEVVERDRCGRERKLLTMIRDPDDARVVAFYLARESRSTVVDLTGATDG